MGHLRARDLGTAPLTGRAPAPVAGTPVAGRARARATNDLREFTGRLAPDGRLELDGLPAEPLVLTVILEGGAMDDERQASDEADSIPGPTWP